MPTGTGEVTHHHIIMTIDPEGAGSTGENDYESESEHEEPVNGSKHEESFSDRLSVEDLKKVVEIQNVEQLDSAVVTECITQFHDEVVEATPEQITSVDYFAEAAEKLDLIMQLYNKDFDTEMESIKNSINKSLGRSGSVDMMNAGYKMESDSPTTEEVLAQMNLGESKTESEASGSRLIRGEDASRATREKVGLLGNSTAGYSLGDCESPTRALLKRYQSS